MHVENGSIFKLLLYSVNIILILKYFVAQDENVFRIVSSL